MSNERRKPYPFDQIEPKWQAHWDAQQTFRALNPGEAGFDPAKPKYYVLDMFPYPSGAGLHVGHPEGYTATDIVARAKRMQGFNVLHPMGWDAFGLPAEQYAIKTGQHPAVTTAHNVAHFKAQLKRIGFSYDWTREINTTDPDYFRWTQWIFLKLYDSWLNPATNRAESVSTYPGDDVNSVRLAFVSEAPVNWCPQLGTVLANEEVIDGKSEVGGFPVERRPMRQWMLRITAFAQRLIDELDGLDWPESIKLLQRNWIGRSEGAEVRFEVSGRVGVPPAGSGILPERTFERERADEAADRSQDRFGETPKPAGGTPTLPEAITISVFTTRPDTLFGATYLVLAPEHRLVDEIITPAQAEAVRAYREKASRKSDLERTELAKEKSGVFTGAYAINPVNSERIPIWIADYVLTGYGTGAIMAVPAHDERDYDFARTFELPIHQVVQPPGDEAWQGFTGAGVAVNSGFLDGLPTAEAKAAIISWLEERALGRKTINFKLRDWLFSRQRYWGEPFPIVWEDGQHRSLSENELPLTPPELDDFKPTGTGEPPLAKAKTWVQYSEKATRETNTMPQWAGSCWYYLRYCDPANSERFISKNAESYWMTGKAIAEGDFSHFTEVGKNFPSVPNALTEAGTNLFGPANPLATFETNIPDLPNPLARPEPFVPGVPNPSGKPATLSPGVPNPSAEPEKNVNTPANALGTVKTKPGGVDLYVGGTEHAVLHLLYARFWHKVLFDLGYVSTPEPFQRLVNQGIILGEDGQKMSKSRGNVVNPDEVINEYGADSLRLYEMFMGPLEQMKPWSMNGVDGVSRFLARVWRLVMEEQQDGSWALSPLVQDVEPTKAQRKVIHATIKKVTEDIETLGFNTAISQMMIFVNAFTNAEVRPRSAMRTLLLLLNPFAPHLTEELWATLSLGAGSMAGETWPTFDPQYLVEDEVEYPVQINGKLRDKIVVPKDATREAIEATVLATPKIVEHTSGKEIKKVIVVTGKLVNIVVAG